MLFWWVNTWYSPLAGGEFYRAACAAALLWWARPTLRAVELYLSQEADISPRRIKLRGKEEFCLFGFDWERLREFWVVFTVGLGIVSWVL